MSAASNEGEQNLSHPKPLRLTDLGRLALLGTAVHNPALAAHFPSQAWVIVSLLHLPNNGRLGALAQCSKVKRHLGEVIRLKEGVICQKGRVKWIGRQWTERPPEPPNPPLPSTPAPPTPDSPTTFSPSFPSVPLHLVRTSFPAGACSFRGVVLPALQNARCVAFLQLQPRKCVWTGPTAKAHRRLLFPVSSVILYLMCVCLRACVCVLKPYWLGPVHDRQR